jgi:hypothetical protein
VAAGGQWRWGYSSFSLGKMRKITATHNLCRSCYYWKENTSMSISYKKKQNWPTPKFSPLSISKILYQTEKSSSFYMSYWIVVFAKMKNLWKTKYFPVLLASSLDKWKNYWDGLPLIWNKSKVMKV